MVVYQFELNCITWLIAGFGSDALHCIGIMSFSGRMMDQVLFLVGKFDFGGLCLVLEKRSC